MLRNCERVGPVFAAISGVVRITQPNLEKRCETCVNMNVEYILCRHLNHTLFSLFILYKGGSNVKKEKIKGNNTAPARLSKDVLQTYKTD